MQGGHYTNGSEPDMQGSRWFAQMWAGQERTISLNVTLTLADGDLQVARPGAEPPENTDAAAAAEEGKCAWGGGGAGAPVSHWGPMSREQGLLPPLFAHAHHHSS